MGGVGARGVRAQPGPPPGAAPKGPMPPSFTTMSPEKQREAIRPAEVWPFPRVAWQPEQQQFLGDVRHRASTVDVKMVPLLGHPLCVSPGLWWFTLTAFYASDLELDALKDHAP